MIPHPDDGVRARARIVAAAGLLSALSLLRFAGPLDAQDEALRSDALRVFLDCRTFNCDRRYFRTEITFVSWVQQPQDAQVQIIMTSQNLGGGGREYLLDFIGREELEGRDDHLAFQAGRSDTEDEVLRGITHAMAAGLARYGALLGLAEQFQVVPAEDAEVVPDFPPGLQGGVDDPWDFWVFRVRVNGGMNGEERDRGYSLNGNVSADRVTERWKINLDVGGDWDRREVELDEDSTFVDESRNWSVGGRAVHSVADRWSAAVQLRTGANTFFNRDLFVELRTGVEYSLFPYEDATRRRLTALWVVGPGYRDYEEETIFGRTEETVWDNVLTVSLNLRQPWGEVNVFARGSHYLHDLGKNRLTLGGGMSFRIVRGLSWSLSGRVSRIRDQIHLIAGDLPAEEILVRRRSLATDFDYRLNTGVSISFGSIYNNVVNNRFGFF